MTHTPVSTRSGHTVSHYEIQEPIGSGGMGDVYGAIDLRLGRRVALKFLRSTGDGGRHELMREAHAASLLDHPNICTIFEIDETPAGDVFIAMPRYDGVTLDHLLAEGALDPPRALSIALQTARGLAAAHEELIVHRDIKPGNLMILRGDLVKILDFGLARSVHDAEDAALTEVAGTPLYMSPEQLRGERLDQRSDIWSLGVVFYEMVTGQRPFAGDSARHIVASILDSTPVRPSTVRPGIPAGIERIITRALEKNVRRRYERTDELIHDLQDVHAALDSKAITRRIPVASRTALAVLPFEDMSESQDQGFLCNGIAEEIMRALGRIPELHVASRTSAFQFRNRTADIREIGAQLNVNSVLEGSVRRVGNRVRISVQLVNVDDGYRLWYERYDRQMQDLFAIEDEIAEQVSRALEVALGTSVRVARTGSPDDAQAYELYLRGREFIHQHRRKGFETALQVFAQAIEINPHYARAHAGIAECHAFICMYFGGGDAAAAAAESASARALELAPDLPEAHASRGAALFLRGNFDDAERHLRRAIELAPRLYDAHYMFARLYFMQGQFDRAATCFAEACAVVPEAFDAWYLLGMCYQRLDDPVRARHANLESIEAVKRWVRVHPEDTRAWTMGASVLAAMGEPERAARWVERALAVDADEPIIEYNAACVYVGLQRPDDAIRCLRAALGAGGVTRNWALNDPDLDPLRNDPRFQEIINASEPGG
ncbi:MAG TPA: protein kinase [Candidatus Krumholzibacteria bacterium]|nr:protein kinase [Candidatus Krumholzibacteria bacterium]